MNFAISNNIDVHLTFTNKWKFKTWRHDENSFVIYHVFLGGNMKDGGVKTLVHIANCKNIPDSTTLQPLKNLWKNKF